MSQSKLTLQGETGSAKESKFPKPLKYVGALDGYKSFDITPVIGREFPNVQPTEILKYDAKIRDLAITSMPQIPYLSKHP